jgi:hypothetical protein
VHFNNTLKIDLMLIWDNIKTGSLYYILYLFQSVSAQKVWETLVYMKICKARRARKIKPNKVAQAPKFD